MDDVIEKVTHCKAKLERYPNISDEKMLHYIHKLKNLPVSIRHLEATKVGRTVNYLKKADGKVGEKARQLVSKWKTMVMEEERGEKMQQEATERYEEDANEEEEDDDDEERYYIDEDAHQEEETKHEEESSYYNHSVENGRVESGEEDYVKADSGGEYAKSGDEYVPEPYTLSNHVEQSDGEDYETWDRVDGTTSYNNGSIDEASDDEDPPSKKMKYDYDSGSNSASKYQEGSSKYRNSTGSSSKYDQVDESSKYNHDRGKKRKKSTSSDHSGRYSSPEKEAKLKKNESHRKHHKRKEHDKKEESKKSSKKHDRDKSHSKKEKESKKEKKEKSHSHSEKRRKSCDTSESQKKDKTPSNGHVSRDSKKESSSGSSSHTGEKKKEKVKSTASSSSSSSQKSKKVIKTLKNDEGVDGGGATSFADVLGCVDTVKKKKKKKEERSDEKKKKKRKTSSDHSSPVPEKPARLLDAPPPEPLPSDLTESLPELNPDYKPLPPRREEDSPIDSLDDELTIGLTKAKTQRQKVFCGRRKGYGMGKDNSIVPTLFHFCIQSLIEHIDYLEFTGGVPYDILKPVFDRATAQQLLNLENFNPYILEETDYLWKKHCEREFRNKKREEMETYREMYLRCRDEREERLKNLMVGIKHSYKKAEPARKTILAYVDIVAKPPRGVAKQQAKFGTGLPVGHEMKAVPPSKAPSRPTAPAINAAATTAATTSVPAPSSSRANSTPGPRKPKVAPLMQKTLKFMKNRFRR